MASLESSQVEVCDVQLGQGGRPETSREKKTEVSIRAFTNSR